AHRGSRRALRAPSVRALRRTHRGQDGAADLAPLLDRQNGRPHTGDREGQDRRTGRARRTNRAERTLRGNVRAASCQLPLTVFLGKAPRKYSGHSRFSLKQFRTIKTARRRPSKNSAVTTSQPSTMRTLCSAPSSVRGMLAEPSRSLPSILVRATPRITLAGFATRIL